MLQAAYAEEVRNQYEHYPYPMVNPQQEKTRLYMPILEALDRMNYFCFSGRRDFRQPFRALIAGGGTGDATIALAEQLRDCPADIVYLDISRASMEVAQARAAIRGLTNITWIHESLLGLPKLDLGTFDYINSSGVLHHLPDPMEGFHTLAGALKDDGAMGLMLYARYGRMAVYQLQEALRLLTQGVADPQARVDHAKSLLNHLPATHWFNASPSVILGEIRSGDIAIYDLLLHSQDRAYSIPELYETLDGAGLHLVQLFSDDPTMGYSLYQPVHYLKDQALAKQAASLPLREQHALAELLHGKIAKHTFYAAKRPPALPQPDDLEMIPLLGFDIFSEHAAIGEVIRDSGDVVLIRQTATGVVVALHKTPHLELIFRYIDGKATLREIFRKVMDSPTGKKHRPNFQTLTEEFKALFAGMSARNWMFLRHASTAPVVYPDLLQARVTARYATNG